MILDIGKGWQIDTAHDDSGERWAQLWGPATLLSPAGRVFEWKGFDAVETCLDEFEQIMGMDDDQINVWQNEGTLNHKKMEEQYEAVRLIHENLRLIAMGIK